MGTILQWRKFHFFDIRTVVDASHFSELISNSQITCTESGRGIVYIGDSEGNVHLINRQLQISSFNADNAAIKQIFVCDNTNLLITIKDNIDCLSTLKVWSLDRFTFENPPSCIRTIQPDPRIYQTNASSQEIPVITAISFSSNISLLAVGFSDGAIILYKDVQRERGCKANNLSVNISSPITNLHIRYTQKHSTHLFVTTEENIFCINVLAKSKEGLLKIELDNWGCNVGCSTLSDSKHDHELLVARDDAIYAYTTDSRTSCYVFEGQKVSVSWFRGYLVVVAREEIAAVSRHMMTIYDPVNKLVASSKTIDDFVNVVCEWGGLYVVTSTPSVLHLSEIDLQSKLDLLFKKNQFDIAISIAKMQYCDQEEVCEILKQYGDWLYGKGNSVAAMEQYIKTIPYLEPSYVIKKFLDTQHIENLTIYLQALHKTGHATSDHTTLMLNCYTRLRDTEQLDSFILDKEIECNVDVAVKVCRGAGYLDHALSLSLKHNLHELYLSILINDKHDYDAAFTYLLSLDRPTLKECILQYGTSLLKHRPNQLVSILVDLCTKHETTGEFKLEDPEEFEHLLIGQSEWTILLLEKVMSVRPLSQQLNTFLLSELLHQYSLAPEGQDQNIIGDKILKLLRNDEVKYDRDHTLLFCDKHNFSSGKLVIWEQTGMFEDLLEWHADNGDFDSVVEVCRRHGQNNRQLWASALRLLTQEKSAVGPDMELLNHVLKKIDEYELLPPLTVANYITSSPHITLGQVREYIQGLISQQTASLQTEVSQFSAQQEAIANTKQTISALASETIYFTNTKCNICNNNLELPSSHFLCRHSFHKHCLESYSENDDCPLCAPEAKALRSNLSNQDEKSYSVLQEHLDGATDCFSVLSNAIANGVFVRPNQTPFPLQFNWKQETPVRIPPPESVFHETPKFPHVEPSRRPKESLNDHITIPAPSKPMIAAPSTAPKDISSSLSKPRQEIRAKSENPFEDDANPFTDDFEDEQLPANPFEEESSTNPFVEEDDYDEAKNPFVDDSSSSPKKTYNSSLNPFED